MKKNLLEKIFFIFINLCFTSLGANLYGRFTTFFSLEIIIYLHQVNPLTNDNTNRDFDLFLAMTLFILIYILIKCILFLILYKCEKQFSYIHTFFDKFRIDRKFMWKMLGSILLSDITISYFSYMFDEYHHNSEIIMSIPFCLIFNYLIFLLFYYPVKQDKIAEDGTIIQGEIANIITNIFIWLNIILIIFVFLLLCLNFIF